MAAASTAASTGLLLGLLLCVIISKVRAFKPCVDIVLFMHCRPIVSSGGSWGLGALGPAIRWGPLQRFSTGGLGRRKSPSGFWGRVPEAKHFGNNILKIF